MFIQVNSFIKNYCKLSQRNHFRSLRAVVPTAIDIAFPGSTKAIEKK